MDTITCRISGAKDSARREEESNKRQSQDDTPKRRRTKQTERVGRTLVLPLMGRMVETMPLVAHCMLN
jgi:hypothetical protein